MGIYSNVPLRALLKTAATVTDFRLWGPNSSHEWGTRSGERALTPMPPRAPAPVAQTPLMDYGGSPMSTPKPLVAPAAPNDNSGVKFPPVADTVIDVANRARQLARAHGGFRVGAGDFTDQAAALKFLDNNKGFAAAARANMSGPIPSARPAAAPNGRNSAGEPVSFSVRKYPINEPQATVSAPAGSPPPAAPRPPGQ